MTGGRRSETRSQWPTTPDRRREARPQRPTRWRSGPPPESEPIVTTEIEAGIDPIRASDSSATLGRQDWTALTPHIVAAGADPDAVVASLRRFSAMLISWNRSYSNLISKNDESRLVARHLLESLAPAHWLKSSGATRWLDFGSGGGLPAVPLLLAGVGESWTLVESRRTKTLFLRRVAQEMGLTAITVVNDRLENLAATGTARFDGFASRATLPLVPTLALAAQMVTSGGSAFLWKGSGRDAEMRADSEWRESWELAGHVEIAGGHTSVARFIRK